MADLPTAAGVRFLTANVSRGSQATRYAAGGYYYPGQDHGKLKDEMRRYLDRGYTIVKKNRRRIAR